MLLCCLHLRYCYCVVEFKKKKKESFLFLFIWIIFLILFFLVCWRFINWRYSKENDSGSIKSKKNNCVKKNLFPPPPLFIQTTDINIMLSPRSFFSPSIPNIYTYILCTDIFQWIIFFLLLFLLATVFIESRSVFLFLCVCVSSGRKNSETYSYYYNILLCIVMWLSF